MRYFNTSGACSPDDHYMLPAAARLGESRRLIDQKNYFVLHAPRQTGKTTSLLDLCRQLTAEGQYAALVVSSRKTRWTRPGRRRAGNPGWSTPWPARW